MKQTKKKRMKRWQKIVCLVLVLSLLPIAVFLIATADDVHFDGDAEVYYQGLLADGFPKDYAHALTELHLLHPEWSFEPLLITEGNSLYTWDYVIEQETADPQLNLIADKSDYSPYRHPFNKNIYDSGHYQASAAAVKYFMDPRNFLNETDIFQFYDLSASQNVSIDEISAVLEGTFMENAMLENGKTYAEYFLEVGKALKVDPVYLAVKARQEQGSDGLSPAISGKCGTLLADYYEHGTQTSENGNSILTPSEGYTSGELRALDGYYNLFNIKASGNGLFSIYYNAMKRAQSGTEVMTDQWGAPAWNTVWKSLYGGAYTIKTSFVDRYQNTIYLQKFNVDSRAADRNFWGQYMQNVTGALTEARTLFGAFASSGVLDGPCNFIIPVYDDMPKSPCADPAGGNCFYLAQTPKKYNSSIYFSNPLSTASDYTVCSNISRYVGGTIQLVGKAEHSYGVSRIEYRWDDGAWLTLCEGDEFDVTLPIAFEAGSLHILTLRTIAEYDHKDSAKKSNWSVLSAIFYVRIKDRPIINISLKNHEKVTTELHAAGTEFTLPDCQEKDFMGWYGSNHTLFPSGGVVTPEEDVTYTALYMRFEQMHGAALVFPNDEVRLRFYAAAESSALQILAQTNAKISFFATVTYEDGTKLSTPVTFGNTEEAFDTSWCTISADTENIDVSAYHKKYSLHFCAICVYSDGSMQAYSPNGIYCERSAIDVANAALSDTMIQYNEAILQHLLQIISSTTT